MIEFLAISTVVLILLVFALGFFCWRLWQQTERNDRTFANIHGHLNNLHVLCVAILTRPIYSDDVMVRAFVDVIKDVEPYLLSVDTELYFDEEIPEAAKALEGYNQIEKQTESQEEEEDERTRES